MPTMFNHQLERDFYNRFNERNLKYRTIGEKEYSIKAVRPNKRIVPYDFSINIGNRIIGLVEIKSSRLINIFDTTKLENFASENNIRYAVLSDSERFIVTDSRNNNQTSILNFEEFCVLMQEREQINVLDLTDKIADTIKRIILVKDIHFPNELLSQLTNEIVYDEVEQNFSFRDPSNINSSENLLFRYLLKDGDPIKKVFRYTSLSTIFSMLNYNSFRMNCLVGMNDTTEVNYAENYVFGTNRDFALSPWQTIAALNRRFISSCSLKEDDLTQWRLYADDSRGVCLAFDVKEDNSSSKFIIKRISYGEKDGTHKVLDIIKEIIAQLKSDLEVEFEFKTLNIWRHFFKPFDYKVEDEVRILHMHQLVDVDIKKEWLLTASHSILNPFVQFKLNDELLPVTLTEIILGPKCPEKEINKPQFEQFIRELKQKKKKISINNEPSEIEEYNLDKLKVSISKIKNYR